MVNKEQLCRAFCADLEVREVPAGLAVRTGYHGPNGDALGFYITRHPLDKSKCRLEDSGLVVPMLESSGVNLDSGARAEAFAALLDEYSASYDDESMELHSEYVEESALPDMAMRFIALLLRVQDLELLNPQTVENTFRQDAQRALSKYFDSKATIEFDTSPAGSPDYVADAVIRADQRDPVALYFGTRDARVDEAVMLWMDTRLTGKPCRVALLLESEKTPIAGRSKRRAMNRLDATTVFRGDEQAAMSRIGQLVGVPGEAWH